MGEVTPPNIFPLAGWEEVPCLGGDGPIREGEHHLIVVAARDGSFAVTLDEHTRIITPTDARDPSTVPPMHVVGPAHASFIGPCRLDRDANVPEGPGDRRRRVSAAGTRG